MFYGNVAKLKNEQIFFSSDLMSYLCKEFSAFNMTEKDAQLIKSLSDNIARLKEIYAGEAAKRAEAESQIVILQSKLESANKKIDELKFKCNTLTDAGLLSATEEQRKESKERLKQMVRDIDRCLSLLK
ncbi:MAG: hypothetical protein NDJ65_00215 [Paludibacteraceae bacterium]|nr:hypothetical protein [Paludibacteraceae bacterium]